MKIQTLSFFNIKSLLFIVLLLSIWIIFNNSQYSKLNIIRWDASGYYAYLPSFFIYKDIKKQTYYDTFLDVHYFPAADIKRYGQYYHKNTGGYTNKYPMGTAIMQMPFFLVCHIICHHFFPNLATGYSSYYHLSIQFSTLFYALFSLYILYSILIKHFENSTSLLTCIILYFGTNTLYYTLFESGMSHVYSLFIYSCVFYLSHKIFIEKNPSGRHITLIILSMSLAIIVRPIDAMLIILPIGLFCQSSSKLQWIKSNIKHLALGILFGSIPILTQILYWKITSGNFIIYSYEGEYFDFLHSEFIKGVFSFRKGWFIYTPIAGIMMLSGFYMIYRKNSLSLMYPIMIFMFLYIYIVFSWHNWYYGGGFSARPLIQTYALLSFPLAYFLEKIKHRNQMTKCFLSISIILLFTLNLFQTYQYKKGIIHYDSMTRELYWKNFWKLN